MTPINLIVAFFVGAFCYFPAIQAFSVQHQHLIGRPRSCSSSSSPSSSCLRSSSSTEPSDKNEKTNDLFSSTGWPAIKEDLNTVPVFCCANAAGQPFAYLVETKDNKYTVPFFFCDVEDAKVELEKTRANSSQDGVDLIPYPLGKAFELWANDEAVIVPGAEAIKQAGAPPGTNPIGQEVPLFACMEIMQEQPPRPDGKSQGPCLPLFMALEEANAAMDQAIAMDGGNPDEFEVVSLSLSRAIELLATIPETPAFQFMPPLSSIKHIQQYMSE